MSEQEVFEKFISGEEYNESYQLSERDKQIALYIWQASAERKDKEIEALRGFAKAIYDEWPDIGSFDGFDLQEMGEEHGLLKKLVVYERCGEFCACAEYCEESSFKFGVDCYRKTQLLTGVKE